MHKSESEVTQPCPTLRNPMDCSLPGSSIHGIFQARVLEWGALPSPKMSNRHLKLKMSQIEFLIFSPKPAPHTAIPISTAGSSISPYVRGNHSCVWKSFSCVWLFATPWIIHRILQARILEWVAIPFSRRFSQTQGSNQGLLHFRWILYQLSYQGSPVHIVRPKILTLSSMPPFLSHCRSNSSGNHFGFNSVYPKSIPPYIPIATYKVQSTIISHLNKWNSLLKDLSVFLLDPLWFILCTKINW